MIQFLKKFKELFSIKVELLDISIHFIFFNFDGFS